LRQSGCSQSIAMRLVNHSSTLVHELYQRHCVEDLRESVNAGQTTASFSYPATDSAAPSDSIQFSRLGCIS
jgi:hypothetical protein